MSHVAILVVLAAGCVSDADALKYYDRDGDGFHVPEAAQLGGVPPWDCDDADAASHPDAAEICDGIDNDCDEAVDDDASDGAPLHRDADGDGFGSAADTVTSCSALEGYVADASDCDDGNRYVSPDASEYCNGYDDDCDGGVDNDALDAEAWYPDSDGDGYGSDTQEILACLQPLDSLTTRGDCDDSNNAIRPDADETCDDVDNDCDGVVDEDDSLDARAWYRDDDGDSYGRTDDTLTACVAPIGYVEAPGDCDDGDDAINPGAEETDCADPTDYNCDGATGYVDDDGDGWAACAECDDTNVGANPDADELCDGVNNDCDKTVDESDAIDVKTWYRDADSDGYGDATISLAACSKPSGYVADSTDCDDANGAINPGNVESMTAECSDTIDNDCDGRIDTDGYGGDPGDTDCTG